MFNKLTHPIFNAQIKFLDLMTSKFGGIYL